MKMMKQNKIVFDEIEKSNKYDSIQCCFSKNKCIKLKKIKNVTKNDKKN